jgi:hypothetical protein
MVKITHEKYDDLFSLLIIVKILTLEGCNDGLGMESIVGDGGT